MIRLLLVGCGKIAVARHLPALRSLADEGLVEVIACDVDPARAEAAAAQFGTRWAPDWRAAAAEADAAAVCAPPGPSSSIAVAALDLGLHVLCEKPPGRNVEQARAMAAASSSRPDLVTMIAFNRRFAPLYRRAMARSLELGQPTSFYGRFSRSALGQVPSNTVSDWITADSSHALDLAAATIGSPHSVAVDRRTIGGGPPNAWTVQLYSEGGSAVLLLQYAAGRRLERFEWAGPDYDVVLEPPTRAQWAQSGKPIEDWSTPEISGGSELALAYGFTDEHRSFLEAVRGERERPACDFVYGVQFMSLLDAILRSPTSAVCPVEPAFDPTVVGAHRHGPHVGSRAKRDLANRPRVLFHHPEHVHHRFFSADLLSDVGTRCQVETWSPDDGPAALKDAQVLITGRGAGTLPPELLEAAGALELLVVLGSSVRNIPAPALIDRGVAVCNTADAVAQSVAEHCLLVALAGLRRLTQIDVAMHRGGWPQAGAGTTAGPQWRRLARRLPVPAELRIALRRVDQAAAAGLERANRVLPPRVMSSASDLQGQTVGLIGWGHTARHFTKLLSPFHCDVLVATQAAETSELAPLGARTASMLEVLKSAKVISLHKGLTDQTRGLVGRAGLAEIRPGSVLVNTARGGLIDEPALIERLSAGDVVAALDVYETEPLPKNHPLRRLSNVILTPHNASRTAQEERRIGDQALTTVLRWLDGEQVDALDRSRLARMT